MLVTKEQQEALIDNYTKANHNMDECIGFVDGMNAMLNLIVQIEKRHQRELKMEDTEIVTLHRFLPIPDRNYDWVAYYEHLGEECGVVGYGPTEQEAINNLKELTR
jgi:hypothetical protein